MSHPLDLFVYIMLPTFLALFVLGLDPLAALIVGNIGAFNAYFQHWNVNTPTWMAWFAQRPEAHCVHHERDLHAYNYSALPLWDILFGSYRNPPKWLGQTGYDPPADTRFASMVSFADVNAQTLGAGSGSANFAAINTPRTALSCYRPVAVIPDCALISYIDRSNRMKNNLTRIPCVSKAQFEYLGSTATKANAASEQ